MGQKPLSFLHNWDAWVLGVLGLAVFLRLAGIGYGLPAVFNGDEPHHVNIAVSFGRGSLDPGLFKYPTLWMYALFAAYGLYFAVWSGGGLLHGPREFGELFVWEPGGFYLIGRLLAAALTLGAMALVYRAGAAGGNRRLGLWAAGIIGVSPVVVESAHSAKPDGLLLFWAAWAWLRALRYLDEGRTRDLVWAGAFVGLAGSTQYTAAPLAALIPAAWWARRLAVRGRPAWAALAAALAATPAAFVAGSPYALLSYPAFLEGLRDNWAAYGSGAGAPAAWRPFWNLLSLGDPWGLAAALILWGAGALLWRERPRAALLLLPPLAAACFFGLQSEGGWKRYLLCCLPAAALLSARGMDEAARLWRWDFARAGARWAALALLLSPGALESWAADRALLLPDTRTLSARWIEAHLPPGASILSDHEADSPRLAYSRAHAERLLERARAAGHPRGRYYELMVSGHRGGGFAVWQLRRDPAELRAGPAHARWSDAGRPVLDVSAGLSAARAAGIRYAVLTSFGADSGAEAGLRRYLDEVAREGRLLAEFSPVPGESNGPRVRIFLVEQGAEA